MTGEEQVKYDGKNMENLMKKFPFLVALSLVLAACGSVPQVASPPTQASPAEAVVDQLTPTAAPPTEVVETASPENPESTEEILESTEAAPSFMEDLVRNDEQGQITVAVTPLNLTNPGETLEFEVGLNTHSVDLSMDLAPMATLTTDTGASVQASQWDAPSGGHHASGKLVFPSVVNGKPFLEGAKELTLTIVGLDVPERVFWWELTQ